jgi:hypothetical protein
VINRVINSCNNKEDKMTNDNIDVNTKIKMPVGDEPSLAAALILTNWQATWSRAVALAWKDPEFKSALINDTRLAFKRLGFSGIVQEDDKVLYSLWDLLDIKIVDTDKSHVTVDISTPSTSYSPETGLIDVKVGSDGDLIETETLTSYKVNGWDKSLQAGALKMTLVIQIPPAPIEADQGIALADYTSAGKVCPFSTS